VLGIWDDGKRLKAQGDRWNRITSEAAGNGLVMLSQKLY
jgi:hypothetical protein